MSTSLSQQLQRLAVPQTSALLDSRHRASILFDPDDAATKNRRTIFDLGYSGLHELISINSAFQQFEKTLFNESTLDVERSIETREVNILVDKNIGKFLHHLSPYFMLRPAHLCIEWLLRRFHIHEYNKREFLAFMLPYHETNIFVKCLQTIHIKHSDCEFNWLECLQKPGVPLSKTAIINRAATQPLFLEMVCQCTFNAVTELGTRAHLLQTQINFYVSVVSGALQTAPTVKEWHIVTILPSLISALASDVVDFASAGLIIVSQLITRTHLKLKLLNVLIIKVVNISFAQLRTSLILLLICIFDTQSNMHPKFNRETLIQLVQFKWLTDVLSTLAKEGVAVHYLCVPLISGMVQAIQKKEEAADLFKLFLERLLYDVSFSNADAIEIINSFLDSYVAAPKEDPPITKPKKEVANDNVIDLDSDDDMGETCAKASGFQMWYSDYLKKLENQYTTPFDKAIKDALKSNIAEVTNRSKAIKMAIKFRLKSFDEDSIDIYENLYHHNVKVRLCAVEALIANLRNYKAQSHNQELLKECLVDRLLDDSELIVVTALKLPTSVFVDVLGYEQFVRTLFKILYKVKVCENAKWVDVALPVVHHLTAENIVEHCDNDLILLALMPFLFPKHISMKIYNIIKVIVRSAFAANIKFLKLLKIPQEKNESELNAIEFKRQFLDVISHSKHTPKVLEFIKSIQAQPEDYLREPTRLSHFLVLVTSFMKENLNAEEALFVFKTVYQYCKLFGIKYMNKGEWQIFDEDNSIPLQLFSDFLKGLIRNTKFEKLHSWEQHNADLELCLRVLQLLSKESFENDQPQPKVEWSNTLKEFLNIVFKDTQEKFMFLLNFFIYEDIALADLYYTELRVRCVILLNCMLRNKLNKLTICPEYILKICVALSCRHETLRILAISTLKCMLARGVLDKTSLVFVEQVLGKQEEIIMDNEQFPLVLYTILKPTQELSLSNESTLMSKIFLKKIVNALMVRKESTLEDVVFKAKLICMIRHINDEQLVANLFSLSSVILEKYTEGQRDISKVKLLGEPFSAIFQLICERFDSQSIENILVDYPTTWHLIEKVFASYDVFLMLKGKLIAVPCIFLTALDEHTYDKMPPKYQLGLIKLIIKYVAISENDSIFRAANKTLRHATLDCKLFTPILSEMCKACVGGDPRRNQLQNCTTSNCSGEQLQLPKLAWREGEIFLELMENKKNLTGTDSLIPVLFELLKLCVEVDEQSAVEYVKQLTLSALLNCCQKAKHDGIDLQTAVPKTSFRIDQIVECLRATPNPQTHHNALLLLSHCAALYPRMVLLNIVDIFTFMGSSVVRHDDAFSFHLINNIVEYLLPVLAGANSQNGDQVVAVLKVFSDIMLDVPEHRRLPLYTKFMSTLNAEKYLWKFLCVVFEQHVIEDEKNRSLQKKTRIGERNDNSKRLTIAQDLTKAFGPQIFLQTCIELVNYIQHLPLSKATSRSDSKSSPENTEINLFDVQLRTERELRYYTYAIMQFLSTFTGSQEFLQQIGSLTEAELIQLKPYYQNFIIKTLSFVPVVTTYIDKCVDSAQIKLWKVVLHHLHDILDNIISLLPPSMFLVVVNGLMQHKLLSIRKKVVELLITKLQESDGYFDACDAKYFVDIVKQLSDIISSILQTGETHSNELSFLHQAALSAVKHLSKKLGLKFICEFKEILADISKIIKRQGSIAKIVLATAILSSVEILCNLKTNCLAQLPKLMRQLVDVAKGQVDFVRQNAPDNTTIAITTGLLKLMETLPLFLGPYLVDIFASLSAISTSIETYQTDGKNDQKSTLVLAKIAAVWSKIAIEIPARLLVPSVDKAYHKLYTAKNYADIGMLMKLLFQSISKADVTDLTNVHSELCSFLMFSLEFRVQVCSTETYNIVNTIEPYILDTFVAWVLKLSENSFRPIYKQLHNWALKEDSLERALTFFLLTNKIAENLKSLFVLFANDILQDAASILSMQNTMKSDMKSNSEYTCTELVKSVLKTLYSLFLYDSKGFINTQRFEILMQPIVDQLENRLVLENEELQKTLSSCIAQLAVAVSSDVMWKQLNQQVLMKTRANVPEVRIFAFTCCVEIARKLRDDFTALLPETVPFIAELFEDENVRVETSTRKSIQELEGILGESLQKYF